MSTLYAKLILLDDTGASTYAGNSSNSIYAWGAQIELENNYEDSYQNYQNFRYIRTTGATHSIIASRYGLNYGTDQAPISDLVRLVLNRNLGKGTPGSVKDDSDINTVYNQGLLRMTNYCDIGYIAEDYVGEQRVLTY